MTTFFPSKLFPVSSFSLPQNSSVATVGLFAVPASISSVLTTAFFPKCFRYPTRSFSLSGLVFLNVTESITMPSFTSTFNSPMFAKPEPLASVG